MASPWFFAIACAAAGISILAMWVIGWLGPRRDTGAHETSSRQTPQVSFLFDGDSLTDHDAPKGTKAYTAIDAMQDWNSLRNWVCYRFDGLPETLDSVPEDRLLLFDSTDQPLSRLTLQRQQGTIRVALSHDAGPDPALWHEAAQQLAIASCQTDALNHAPCAVWITNKDHDLVWQNDVFAAFSPEKADTLRKTVGQDESASETTPQQITITDRTGTLAHYEVSSIPRTRSILNFATDVTAIVGAENVRREFVQTLTKTFANLTTGLVVFNRARELALFNPALVDLTTLPVEFLSSRPTLQSFFDNLRDYRVMPEPKSYPDWRARINQMIKSASGGRYAETWNLPNGLTYRVTGRPHPDGAIAFLFEDISDEVASNRHYRAQLDLRHAVLDRLDEAVAVFGPNRSLVFCNEPLSSLLNIMPDNSFADLSFDDLLAACRAEFPSETFWNDVAETSFLSTRKPFVSHIADGAGNRYQCRLAPLPGEATMLCLRAVTDPALSGTGAMT